MRVAIYARYSTDKQERVSIAVQNENVRAYIKKQGWTEVGAYADEAISGAVIAKRPGVKALLASVDRGEVDLVMADELDRLSRSQSQMPMIYERLLFLDVRLHTIAEGEIGRLHVGLKGTMNAEQLAAIARKTRDALAKRFRDGQNPGGLCYGYALDFVADARGDRIPGHRKIVPAEAETVVHIHEQYAAGRSGQDIAIELNATGIPGPRGGRWSASTINGNKSRGTGILNNQLYIGRPEHLRQSYRKDPESGMRHAFRNAEDQRQTVEIPHLRIVSDDLWARVKARQALVAHGPRTTGDAVPAPFWSKQRAKYLLSGKLKCGECGAGYSKNGKHRAACHAATKLGPTACTNRLTVHVGELEAQVLTALQSDLMQPEVVEAFVAEYVREANQIARQRDSGRAEREAELKGVRAHIQRLTNAIVNGVDATLFATELNQLGRRRTMLEQELAVNSTEGQTPALLHPRLAQIYRGKVEALATAFESSASQAEAQEIIRGLIEVVVLTPVDGHLQVALKGDLAAMLLIGQDAKRRKAPGAEALEAAQDVLQVKMVAGTGFEPVTFRL
jgi:site-specific DNA recombinase